MLSLDELIEFNKLLFFGCCDDSGMPLMFIKPRRNVLLVIVLVILSPNISTSAVVTSIRSVLVAVVSCPTVE